MYAARVANVRLHELLGQPAAGPLLRQIVSSGRPAHAYLFQGPPGVGKGTAALAFARALLCERPTDDACGECSACHKSAGLTHPDLRFLFPVTGEEKDLEETIADTLAAWREDPLFVFAYEKAASIRLSLTRELLRELAYEPFEASRRVVVVRIPRLSWPIPGLIDRYIVRTYVGKYFLVMAAFWAIFVLVHFMDLFDDIQQNKVKGVVVVHFYTFFSPSIVHLLTPVAVPGQPMTGGGTFKTLQSDRDGIGFANRLLVMTEWAISFISNRRGVRIFPSAGAEAADPAVVGTEEFKG